MSDAMTARNLDLDRLRRALDLSLNEETREAFSDMLSDLLDGSRTALSEKQRAWVCKVLDEPEYTNAWSAGKVPRGREVPVPEALRVLPKKPPTRRSESDG